MIARHGLTEVYQPPEGSETIALIICIHGLFGHPYKTWASSALKTRSKSPRSASQATPSYQPGGPKRHIVEPQNHNITFRHEGNDSAEDTTFWPRDLLPNLIPDVRIFTWGYDADIDGFGSASQSTINQHAGSLLSDISDQREAAESYMAPIIFVAHSLGGIIAKAALNVSAATQGTRLKDIAPATSGICFLGTPHRGSKSASLGKVAYEITTAATRRPNTKLLQGLERNSVELEQIGSTFAQTLLKYDRKIQIYSFREEKETRKWWVFNTMVVEADSAKIGDGREEVGSIPANHSDMTKFKSLSDVGFKRVVAQLRRWVQELRDSGNASSTDVDECLASLSIEETKFRIADVHKAHDMTFHWLYDPEVVSYSDWLRDGEENTQPLYWIQGKPGSGKSTLMKFAMRDSRTLQCLGADDGPQWTPIAFFFHDRGSTIQKSLTGMLRELLDSVIRLLPQLTAYALTQFRELVKSQRTISPSWSLEALESVMNGITEQRTTRIRLLLFLDALDEHEGDNEQLIRMLRGWAQKSDGYYVKMKICLASRSWNVFEHHLGQVPKFAIDQHTKGDIRRYTQARLESLNEGPQALLTPQNVASMAHQIATKAQGVFIWVRLAVDQLAQDIQDGTPHQALERKIAGLPDELKDLYDQILQRIQPTYAKETHIMIQLVLCSIKPLPLESLVNATEYSLNTYVYGEGQPMPKNSLEVSSEPAYEPRSSTSNLRWLASRSGGLLEVYALEPGEGHQFEATRHYVQFLHQTAKEYVQSHSMPRNMQQVDGPLFGKSGDFFLTMSCRSTLSWVAPIKKHMLLYAKLTEKKGQSDGLLDIAYGWLPRGWEAQSGPCDFAWWLDLQEEPFLKDYRDSFNRATYYLELEHLRFAFIVAANLISIIDKMSTGMWDYTGGPEDSTICLLQIAIGAPNIVPASLQDRESMVKKLLSVGYPCSFRSNPPPSFKSSQYRNELLGRNKLAPLDYLITGYGELIGEEQRISIARALLDKGADVNEKVLCIRDMSPYRISLISYCAQFESAAFVRLLLQYGAKTNQSDRNGWYPVDFAITRQDKSVIAAFNEYGSDKLLSRFDPGILSTNYTAESLMRFSTTIAAAAVYPPLAELMGREHRGPPPD